MNNILDSGDISYLAFPLNLIIGLIEIGGIALLYKYYRDIPVVKWLGSIQGTFWVVGVCVLVLVVEGIWADRWVSSWLFIGLLGILLLNLGLVIARHLRPFSLRNTLFLLNHGGLWLVLGAALLGAPDRKNVKMIVPLSQTEYVAVDAQGRLYPLPFTVTLQNFTADYYEGEKSIPKRFCPEVLLQSRDRQVQAVVEVNKPVSFGGYTLYQDSYDREGGQYSIFLLVRDPWISGVYVGMLMMMAGAAGLMILGPFRRRNKLIEKKYADME